MKVNKIRQYLKDIINYLKKHDIWNIQLTIAINFFCNRETDEERVMYSKIDNIEIIINDKIDEAMEELSQSLLSRYQIWLEMYNKGNHFIYDCFHL